jgi:hypothetical protein
MGNGGNDLDRDRHYLVFSQHPPQADVDAWNAHATRFFDTRLELASQTPLLVAVRPFRGREGIVSLRVRPREDADLAVADDAERRGGGGGLALLARRCASVWVIDRHAEDDAIALRLAAILAASVLGPIVDPHETAIFGVKTARARLGV